MTIEKDTLMKVARPRARIRSDALLSPDLPWITRAHIRFIRASLETRWLDAALRNGQRVFGSTWIEVCTRNIRHVHGLERLGRLDPEKSYVVVSNHRSFFDLYVVTAYLVYRRLLPHRILFPVRSTFFYESAAGMFVNGVMSLFAMYPPVFRERAFALANLGGLDECVRLLSGPGVFMGLHPEGTRNRSSDPYALLPAQSGVGRIIHQSKAIVIPVFVNGLGNHLPRQVLGNFTRKGPPINVVFGVPLAFEEMRARAGSPRLYRQVSEAALSAVAALGTEERDIRAQSPTIPNHT